MQAPEGYIKISGNLSTGWANNSMRATATSGETREALFSDNMKKAQAGDAAAYRELLEASAAVLRAYVRRILGRLGKTRDGQEDDLVQEVLFAVHQKRHTYRPESPFLPWLFAIARYKVIDYSRRERRRGGVVSIDDVERALETSIFRDPATASDLRTLMAQLPERSRQLLEMVKIDGLSVAEAAARAQISPGAVKVAVHRALQFLRKRGEK